MTARVAALWRGDVPLVTVFWEYAVIGGTILNLATTGAALGALVAGLPVAAVLVIYFLPLPYSLLMIVSVWRSAARYPGDPKWPAMARIAIVVWAAIVTLV